MGTAAMYNFGVSTVWFGDGQHGVLWVRKCLTLWCESSNISWMYARQCLVVQQHGIDDDLGEYESSNHSIDGV